jgi:hypothetical protein
MRLRAGRSRVTPTPIEFRAVQQALVGTNGALFTEVTSEPSCEQSRVEIFSVLVTKTAALDG